MWSWPPPPPQLCYQHHHRLSWFHLTCFYFNLTSKRRIYIGRCHGLVCGWTGWTREVCYLLHIIWFLILKLLFTGSQESEINTEAVGRLVVWKHKRQSLSAGYRRLVLPPIRMTFPRFQIVFHFLSSLVLKNPVWMATLISKSFGRENFWTVKSLKIFAS